MQKQVYKNVMNEGGRYLISTLSFLALGSMAITVAGPVVATGAALVGSYWVFDKLKVTKKK